MTLRRLAALPVIADAPSWVASELDGLFAGDARPSGRFVGGQTAADRALDQLTVRGYARRRNEVLPVDGRGATALSPYIRHGLLPLRVVHDHPNVADAPSADRTKYRSELLWQEYARHWYAVLGVHTRRAVDFVPADGVASWERDPWPGSMACVQFNLDELHGDGYVVNQARMWMASQWSVRAGADWREGEDWFFRHLLDGSRAANRNGWQWSVGGIRAEPYGFARRQVRRRAPELCERCELRDDCPIESYPPKRTAERGPRPPMDGSGFGPTGVEPSGGANVDAVWLTAESLGDADPALSAHPDADVHFVFDEPLLRHLRLDGKRLVFLTQCLADLAERRTLSVWRGRPGDLADEVGAPATTFAPVPGFRRRADELTGRGASLAVHPWPWLRPPTPALLDHLGTAERFPWFRRWAQLTGVRAPDAQT